MSARDAAIDAALAKAIDETGHCFGALLAARVHGLRNTSIALDAMADAGRRANGIHAALLLAAEEMNVELDARAAAAAGETHERRADA